MLSFVKNMIKKILVLMTIIAAVLPMVWANALQIEKSDESSVIISELNNPAVFDFIINNPEQEQQAEIYSLVGISFDPKGFFDLQNGKNEMKIKVYPSSELRKKQGVFNFEYEIKGKISGITKDTLTIRIAALQDSITVKSASDINVGDDNTVINVANTQNVNLENIKLLFDSPFFNEEKRVSLSPFESANVSVKIDKDKIKSIAAGQYIFKADIELENAKTSMDNTFNYLPKEDTMLTKNSEGFIVRKVTYIRTNTGNVPVNAKIDITKDILSRLFTINQVEPMETKRNALYATYYWEKNLQPEESYSITSTTNYTFPFILILLIIIIVLLVKLYTRTNVVVNKRVSFVKTKGGEFALKVRIHVKAKKYVENAQIIDRLPGMTKLYEKFGIAPDKIELSTRRLFWNIDKLNAGEERVYSYIVYSKMMIVGRFELPAVTVSYQRNGKTEQTFSNRTFFVAETTRTDI